MNSRGLTEIVVLTVGLKAGILDQRLYSLLVVMALVTTIMTGPLLDLLGRPRSGGRPDGPGGSGRYVDPVVADGSGR